MKRALVSLAVVSLVTMLFGCTPPLSKSDKALMEQAIAANASAQAAADRAESAAGRAESAADRAEAAAQRAEDAALKCEKAFETSLKK